MLGCMTWILNLFTCRNSKQTTALAQGPHVHPDFKFVDSVHTHFHVSVGDDVSIWGELGRVREIHKYYYKNVTLVWFAYVEWHADVWSWELIDNIQRIESMDTQEETHRVWDLTISLRERPRN